MAKHIQLDLMLLWQHIQEWGIELLYNWVSRSDEEMHEEKKTQY